MTTLQTIERWVPGVRAARTYRPGYLPRDLMAGLVLSALLVPQGMAYAELAGLPAITGLYTTIVALVAYAAIGPSPFLVLGPDSSLGPMIAAAILPLAAGSDQAAVALAGMLALLVGAVCLTAGLLKLGFVADLLSMPVRMGYLAGLAVTIFVGQLPKLLGISIDADGIVDELLAILSSLEQMNPWAFAVGLLCLVIMYAAQRLAPKAPAVLLAVLAAIAAVVVFDLGSQGVALVGTLPQGFPAPSMPRVELDDIVILAAAAVGISLVAIGDTISTSAGFASRKGYEVDGDQELAGIGAANLLSGLFQGFPVSTSSSRTAVADQSGAKTQLTGIVAAAAVLAMLLFVPGLVRNLPQSALAAVVIMASTRLLDVPALRRMYSARRSEFAMAIACALGVVFVGVLEGIVIAVLLSILQFFERAWRPYNAVLGETDERPGYHDVTRVADSRTIPGLVLLRWDAPLFFANANLFRERVRSLVAEADPAPFWILVAAEPVTDIDMTAAEMLVDLDLELNASDIHLAFAELKDPVRETIVRYGLLETIDHGHFYPTIEAGVAAFLDEAAGRRPDLIP